MSACTTILTQYLVRAAVLVPTQRYADALSTTLIRIEAKQNTLKRTIILHNFSLRFRVGLTWFLVIGTPYTPRMIT